MNYFAAAGIRKESKPPKTKYQMTDVIIDTVCEYTGVDKSRLTLKLRKKELVYCRQLISFFLCTMAGVALELIGETLGGQDHTTVMHSRDTIRDRMRKDYAVKHDVEYLEDKIDYRIKN